MSLIKKGIIGALAIVLLATLTINSTLAFLTKKETKQNIFVIGDLNITLTEPAWRYEDSCFDLEPCAVVPKDPTVTATENDCYFRVYMLIVDKSDDTLPANTPVTDPERLELIYQTIYYNSPGILFESRNYSLAELAQLSMVNPAYQEVGTSEADYMRCFNYVANGGILKEGQKAVLFTHAVVPTNWTTAQLNKVGSYDIILYAQAIQTSGFDDAVSAFAALQKEVDDGTIRMPAP